MHLGNSIFPFPPEFDTMGTATPPEQVDPSTTELPFSPKIAQQASEWLVLLLSGTTTGQERHAWKEWHDADPEHARAWRHIETTNQRLKCVPKNMLYKALSSDALPNHRNFVKALSILMVIGGTELNIEQAAHWLSGLTVTGQTQEISIKSA